MRDKYLLTEGHLLGFAMGAILIGQEWYGIATAWVGVLMILYVYRYWKLSKEDEKEKKTLRYVQSYEQRDQMSIAITMMDVLIEQGFDPERPIKWWDDPVDQVRIFTQEAHDES